MSETAYERVLRALREHGCKVVEKGGQRTDSACPAHEDHSPSLSVTGINGQTLVHCHAGCDYRDVLGALELTPADLYDERSATYRYDDGRTVRRYYDDRGKKRFTQTGARATSTLYHLDQLAAAGPDRYVFLVEGEKDVHAIEAAGGIATTAPQGAQSFSKADVTPLAGRLVVCVVDRDERGEEWAAQVDQKLKGVAKAHRFVRAAEGKDAADHIAAGHDLNAFESYTPPTVKTEAELARPQYGDVAALLAGGIPDPPQPDVLYRVDGHALFYRGKVNSIFGDPEGGKTWVGLAALVEVVNAGGKAAVLDLDHNGMAETIGRMIMLGAKPEALADADRFRYCEPEDAEELRWFVVDLSTWKPDTALVDSLGEVLPMLGYSSNSPDEYTKANREVMGALANSGSAVIVIDHLPKDDAAREKGQTGTAAKKRSINGVSLRVVVKEQFTPGQGGSASLTINKDRPGGLRGHCPPGKNAPAGRFVMTDNGDGTLSWHVTTPTAATPGATGPRVSDQDVAEVMSLPKDQRTKRKIQAHLRCGSDRAQAVLERCRELGEDLDDD